MTPERDPIDFARYAEIMAYLRQFPADKKEEVIARLHLRRRAWETAAAKWAAARDAELASGTTVLSTQFGSVFARTRRRLELQQPTLESLGSLPGPDEASPEPVPAAPEVPEELPPIAPPEVQKSSSQLAAPEPALPSYLRNQPLLAAPPAPPPASEPARSSPGRLQATLPLGAELPLARLPFKEASSAPERAFRDAVAHAQAVQGPTSPRREPRSSLESTVMATSPAGGAALPFPSSQSNQSSQSSPSRSTSPELTLQQYASLRVEIHLQPERIEPILASYGVSVDARAPLDVLWRGRFDADPSLRIEFARAYASYLGWLRANPTPSRG